MLAIKLQRIGRKHQPTYRLVVAEKRSKMKAPPVEDLGHYHPVSKDFSCNRDRILHWLKSGAQPTTSAHNLLIRHGYLPGPKRAVKIKKAPVKAEATASST